MIYRILADLFYLLRIPIENRINLVSFCKLYLRFAEIEHTKLLIN
ncbi:hypothetical protein BACCOP_03983 [Phocaeicola coprocola DSM 17136]|uniref:Uncharacterized protein n=1 Tax=Phocaeicola coprocola DSM 17136 TaxID=470145 RepID=B3JPV1_9BACT|nr:hypothetical protein BACCOP_03983 [Phocaeicola coprocola DSM 17136]